MRRVSMYMSYRKQAGSRDANALATVVARGYRKLGILKDTKNTSGSLLTNHYSAN